ncbi:MAG: hypothetical protein K2W95_00880 [Candidatus Obscuribacterales bacterium]|nr:hypothetical protein [Candidatus Obscuribacterales bacterium]
MISPDLNNESPEQNKHCYWQHEEGHAKAGQRCEGFRIQGSAFCVYHGENAEKRKERIAKQAAKKKELLDALDFDYHELKSVDQVKSLLEKLTNGVISGTIKPDKARVALEALRTMLKTLENRETGGRAFFKLDLSGGKVDAISANLPADLLDAFLMSSATDSIKMIEDLDKQGKLDQIIDAQVVLPAGINGKFKTADGWEDPEPDLFGDLEE